jgi:hypothetical protein
MVARKTVFGRPYVLGVDLRCMEAQLYAIGAALGHALRSKLDILTNLFFVPGGDDHERNRIMNLCKKDAKKNLEEFRSELGREPDAFDDFALYRGVFTREAFNAYLSGDRKTKRLFETQVDTEGVGQELMIMLLQGIQFGSSFPELTERMYENAHKDDKDFWSGKWAHVIISEELRAKSLEETQKAFLQIVVHYASQYYPELVDPLDLGAYLDS